VPPLHCTSLLGLARYFKRLRIALPAALFGVGAPQRGVIQRPGYKA
jgi:hypothetical protein